MRGQSARHEQDALSGRYSLIHHNNQQGAARSHALADIAALLVERSQGFAERQEPGRARLEQHARPVAAVGHVAQIGERALGRADLALQLAQLVAHRDQELAVALALVRRQRQDARQVVALLAALLLAEVPAPRSARHLIAEPQFYLSVHQTSWSAMGAPAGSTGSASTLLCLTGSVRCLPCSGVALTHLPAGCTTRL